MFESTLPLIATLPLTLLPNLQPIEAADLPAAPVQSIESTFQDAVAYERHVDTVLGYTTDFWNLELYVGHTYTITVNGNGSTDLDYFVYDGWGNLIVQDISYSDRTVLWVTPIVSGSFELQIKNLGPRSNTYELILQ